MNDLTSHSTLLPSSPAALELRADWRNDTPIKKPNLFRLQFAALMPDGETRRGALAVPAIPVFEECATGFAQGTLLPTPFGARAIEDICPGDVILDSHGDEDVVTWIGSTTLPGAASATEGAIRKLARVPADPLCGGAAATDFLAGPAARMRIRHARLERLLGKTAVLAPLCDYIDGERIVGVVPHGAVALYHVMLGDHRLLRLAGLEIESYHPGNACMELPSEALRARFFSLFPHIDPDVGFGQASFNRTTRRVIDALLDS